MRIVQLIQRPQLRGAELFACQLSNHLQSSGHEVTVICLGTGNAKLPFAGRVIQLDRKLSRRLLDFGGWKRLAEEIEKLKPEVVQANAGDTLKYAVFSKWTGGWKAPIIYRNANKVSDFAKSWLTKLFNRVLAKQVKRVISVSEQCRLDFIHTYSVDDRKTVTIPIGIERPIISVSLSSDVDEFFSKGPVLVHVASFVPEKNHTGLLDIFQLVTKVRPEVKLLLVGDGQQRGLIVNEIKKRELSGKVFLAGYRPEVLSIMSRASVLVLPSLIEGLPGVILESMYCRTPVIAYDVGGIGEVVRDGVTGWLVPKNDTAAFANAVLAAMDLNSRERITEQAYQLVVRDFDNATITKRFEKVYDSLVTTQPSD